MQGDDIYDAMLNQTNVGDNNNKFYVIQVLGELSFFFAYCVDFDFSIEIIE